ncbi:hypothetical protein Bhyg_05458 [Pseudolycoriella hygida]|uniref:Uncharacterized protein n=1 Tax=Pseudolycoriella hygida TaxID=35572 RepID=A0A9Q0S126_9DIPT|nr:hypothetical protein Bhyg_05458 [Pseudolycoriella hygida]
MNLDKCGLSTVDRRVCCVTLSSIDLMRNSMLLILSANKFLSLPDDSDGVGASAFGLLCSVID